MAKDSIGQKVEIGDIVVEVNSKNPSLLKMKIVGFGNGKFGRKNLPLVKSPYCRIPTLCYSQFIKIFTQK